MIQLLQSRLLYVGMTHSVSSVPQTHGEKDVLTGFSFYVCYPCFPFFFLIQINKVIFNETSAAREAFSSGGEALGACQSCGGVLSMKRGGGKTLTDTNPEAARWKS